MIEILLNDPAFEQDIRELLMAFYPGETFAHQPTPESFLTVEGMVSPDHRQYTLKLLNHREIPVHELHDLPEALEEEVDRIGEPIGVNWEDRTDTKNKVKRRMYALLLLQTGRQLPWGSLTGIRPTKLVLTRLQEGMEPAKIRDFLRKNYYTGETKIDLAIDTAVYETELLKTLDYAHGYSLYVGIPFCPTTCLYCSFTSYPIGKWKNRTGEYLQALFHEMDQLAVTMKGKTPDTVYIGGGTPTALSAEDLEALCSHMEETFDLKTVREWTVEAGRPDSITEEKLRVLKKHGISRISINPQTMKQETLDLIGRHHTVEMVKEKFALARSLGFDNINMDLIVGLPGEDMEDVRRTMEEIRALDPESVTVHSLAIKRASRLNLMKETYASYKITNTQEMIDLTADCCREMGMKPYYLYRQKNMAGNFENVGYAKPQKACIYNVLIMEEQQTIAACGAGTTTKVLFPGENRRERWENVKDVDLYMARIDEMIEKKNLLLRQL